MAASDKTIVEILRVIRQHVDEKTMRKIVKDLMHVQGNRSFRDTIVKLATALGVE